MPVSAFLYLAGLHKNSEKNFFCRESLKVQAFRKNLCEKETPINIPTLATGAASCAFSPLAEYLINKLNIVQPHARRCLYIYFYKVGGESFPQEEANVS